MKSFTSFFFMLLIVLSAGGQEKTFTGSTPAGHVVKTFLGIPVTDSVDFIRWTFVLRNDHYDLRCNYGIGQANTNGFINGGKQIEITGESTKQKNVYSFHYGTKTLRAVMVNTDLFHLLSTDNSLLNGNGGWSYTLNNTVLSGTDEINFITVPAIWKDSIVFEGRTPCGVPGVTAAGQLCYKLKWLITLYAGDGSHSRGSYKILGTRWRAQGGRKGKWITTAGKGDRILYQLRHDDGGVLYLLAVDGHLLFFTDGEGKLLVGNEDFSYTLNRRW